MRELSIEEKAKRYDEAIKVAADIKAGTATYIKDGTPVVDAIFPELKESEDEKWIPKEIANYLKEKGDFRSCWIAWLEKQGEQKPADKVEPKFKDGDYIVYRDYVWKVFNISLEKYYELLKINNEISTRSIEDVDNNAHLWTIQDAKDGDVLCTYECDEPKIVFVLKGTPKKHYALSYYCFYNIMYPHFDDGNKPGCLAPEDSDVKPATKEQRDTLMKAMADAGYTFDFESKELKKIEQKPAWSEEDVLAIERIIDTIQCAQLTRNGKPRALYTDEILDNLVNWLKSLKDRVGCEVNCITTKEWSEDDEKNLRVVVDYLIADNGLTLKHINWLKSLRPQSQNLMSEEEFAHIVGYLVQDIVANEHMLEDEKQPTKFFVEKYYNKLRPQNTWKPSDEQLNNILDVLSFDNCTPKRRELLKSLYNDLKKLKA